MKCEEVQPLLDLLCDGALEPKDCALVLDHTKKCQHCHDQWSALEELHMRFQKARQTTAMPSDLMAKISQQLKQEEKSSAPGLFSKTARLRPILMVAAAALLTLLVPLLWHTEQGELQLASLDAETLVADLAADKHVVQLPDKAAAAGKLGYEMKFLNLADWRMARAAIYEDASKRKLAKFDFVSKDPRARQSLSCYQGRQGEIRMAGGKEEIIAGKLVRMGQQQNLQYALFSDQGRDYLLVTSLSHDALTKIIARA